MSPRGVGFDPRSAQRISNVVQRVEGQSKGPPAGPPGKRGGNTSYSSILKASEVMPLDDTAYNSTYVEADGTTGATVVVRRAPGHRVASGDIGVQAVDIDGMSMFVPIGSASLVRADEDFVADDTFYDAKYYGADGVEGDTIQVKRAPTVDIPVGATGIPVLDINGEAVLLASETYMVHAYDDPTPMVPGYLDTKLHATFGLNQANGATVGGDHHVDVTASVQRSIEVFFFGIPGEPGYIQLVNDEDAPGNSKLYGTNGSGTLGWYDRALDELVGASDTGTPGHLDDTVVDGDGIDITFAQHTITINTDPKFSIEHDVAQLQLVNDVDVPGESYFYGTDPAGAKGWQLLPIQHSIEEDAVTFKLQLVNDEAAPGNLEVYGTSDVTGTKAWYNLDLLVTTGLSNRPMMLIAKEDMVLDDTEYDVCELEADSTQGAAGTARRPPGILVKKNNVGFLCRDSSDQNIFLLISASPLDPVVCADAISDEFTGTNGDPISPLIWVVRTDLDNTFTIEGNTARMTVIPAGDNAQDAWAWTDGEMCTPDMEAYADMNGEGNLTGAGNLFAVLQLQVRVDHNPDGDPDNYYWGQIQTASTGTDTRNIGRRLAGSNSVLATDSNGAQGEWHAKADGSGSNNLSAWIAGGAAALTATDANITTGLHAGFKLRGRAQTSLNGGYVDTDDFLVVTV